MGGLPQPEADSQEEFRRLLARWSDVSERLRQERQAPVEAFLRESKPMGFDEDDRLVLVFPRAMEFHKVSLEQPRNKDVLERVLGQWREGLWRLFAASKMKSRRLTAFPSSGEGPAAEVPGEITEVEALEPAAGDSGNPALEAP